MPKTRVFAKEVMDSFRQIAMGTNRCRNCENTRNAAEPVACGARLVGLR